MLGITNAHLDFGMFGPRFSAVIVKADETYVFWVSDIIEVRGKNHALTCSRGQVCPWNMRPVVIRGLLISKTAKARLTCTLVCNIYLLARARLLPKH